MKVCFSKWFPQRISPMFCLLSALEICVTNVECCLRVHCSDPCRAHTNPFPNAGWMMLFWVGAPFTLLQRWFVFGEFCVFARVVFLFFHSGLGFKSRKPCLRVNAEGAPSGTRSRLINIMGISCERNKFSWRKSQREWKKKCKKWLYQATAFIKLQITFARDWLSTWI